MEISELTYIDGHYSRQLSLIHKVIHEGIEVTGLHLVALPASDVRSAVALPRFPITAVVIGTAGVTVAILAAIDLFT